MITCVCGRAYFYRVRAYGCHAGVYQMRICAPIFILCTQEYPPPVLIECARVKFAVPYQVGAGLETAINTVANATNIVVSATKTFRAVANLRLDFTQTSTLELMCDFFDLRNGNTSAILLRKYAVGDRGAQSLPPDLSKSLGTYPPTPPLDRNTNPGQNP